MNFSQLDPFTISRGSSSLSAAIVSESDTDPPNFGVLLMFHDSNEFPVLLYGIERKIETANGFGIALVWTNITNNLLSELGTEVSSLRDGNFSNFAYGGDNRTSSFAMSFPAADFKATSMFDLFALDIVGQTNASSRK